MGFISLGVSCLSGCDCLVSERWSDPQSLPDMAVTDTESRLASSIPSMLMSYLTGAGAGTELITPPQTTPSSAIIEKNNPVNVSDPKTFSVDGRQPFLPHRAPSPTKSLPSMLLDGLDDMSYASGDVSREGSIISNNATPRKRTSKPKTSYSICQPPPKSQARQKIHVRARPLLQLHKLSAFSRPVPAFELLPSVIFSPSLSRAISKFIPAKHGLCPSDLAIVKANSYHQHEQSGADEDESRDILAIICKGRRGDATEPVKAKIFLEDGNEWEAYSMPNGGYEFTSIDEHGLTATARWVPKRPRGSRSQSATTELESPRPDVTGKKFNFSTIMPSSRRHPVIANLTSTTLDILDSYRLPTPSTSPTGKQSEPSEAESVDTTPGLRSLITATAIWVGLREGWSSGYRYEDSLLRSPSSRQAQSPTKATSGQDTFKNDGPVRRSSSIAKVFRFGAMRKSAASPATDGSAEDVPMSSGSSISGNASAARRLRAESNATVIHKQTWPHQDFRNMRRPTGLADEMTEEGGDQIDSAIATPDTPSKRYSIPIGMGPIDLGSLPVAATENISNGQGTRKKRSSSSAALSVESKHLDNVSGTRRRREKVLRLLLCGMA